MTSPLEKHRLMTIEQTGKPELAGKTTAFPEFQTIFDLFPRLQICHKSINVKPLAVQPAWTKKRGAVCKLSPYLRPSLNNNPVCCPLRICQIKPEFIEWWKVNCVHGEYDTHTFELIRWNKRLSLLTLQASQIISSRWIAIIYTDERLFSDYDDTNKRDGEVIEVIKE